MTIVGGDLLILNAKVWTPSPARPRAEAVAVRAGRIAAVGSNRHARARHAGEVVDAAGRLLLPGFNDAHAHLVSAGTGLLAPDFRAAAGRRVSGSGRAATCRSARPQWPGRCR